MDVSCDQCAHHMYKRFNVCALYFSIRVSSLSIREASMHDLILHVRTVDHLYVINYGFVEFPGSKPVSEASTKYGPALVSGPVLFVFEKVSTFIITEEKDVEAPPAEATTSGEATAVVEEKEEIVVEEEKEEAAVEAPEPAKEAAEPPKP